MTDAYGESRGWFIGGQATQSRSGRWVSKACTSGNTTLHWSPFPLPPRETMVGPTATAVLSKSVVKVPEKGLRWVSGGGFLLRRRQRSEEGSTENQSIRRPRWARRREGPSSSRPKRRPRRRRGRAADDQNDDLDNESEIHRVRVIGGNEVERQQRDGKDCDEAVDAGALVRREYLPPPDGAVGKDHSHVEGIPVAWRLLPLR